MELKVGDRLTLNTPFAGGHEAVGFTVTSVEGDRVEAVHRSGAEWELTAVCSLHDIHPTLFGWLHGFPRPNSYNERTKWKVKIPA